MFERHKGEEGVTGQGLWPLPLLIQVLIAGVSLCVWTSILYHGFWNAARFDGL